ncbi:MAG: enoyl-CoA hydratase-related protein [Roseiflexaceae bacterium]|nr:enoyl-CoA hydratase-related protein [Roseiflexaceae bacterium]
MADPIRIVYSGPTATVVIDRPDVRNAFDTATIAGLHQAFMALTDDKNVRAVVLTGAGEAFCAGGDMNWMRNSVNLSVAENLAEAEAMAAMFDAIWNFPKPLIARVNGAAIGGGAGLVACCDIAIAAETARFGFGEVKIGIIPAVIGQYVVPKIGYGHARALFVTGERFTAERAFEIGLVHAVTPTDELDVTVSNILNRTLTSGPQAVAATKSALNAIWYMERDAARRYVIELIADIRTGEEAQEGLQAFLAKRRPAWTKLG